VDKFAEASAVATRALAALNLPSAPRRRLLAAALPHPSNSPELQLHACLSAAGGGDFASSADASNLDNLRMRKSEPMDSSVSANPEAATNGVASIEERNRSQSPDQIKAAPTTPQQKIEFKDRYLLGPSTC